MATSAPRNSRKKPQDVTGRKAEQLAAEHQEELAAKAAQVAMITAQTAAEVDQTVDLTGDKPVVVEGDGDEPKPAQVEARPVEVAEPYSTIRTNCDLEQVTVGHGNSYDFKMGVKYRVPRHVADHLEEKGLVWH